MKVLYICGDYPPNSICATADTSFIMVNALSGAGHKVEVLTNVDWALSNFFAILKRITGSNADALFMPYATLSYRYSLVPQIIAILNRRRIVILIHEVSKAHILRKLSLLPFSICKFVVFTNRYEREYFHRIFPWTLKESTSVIPIGSNIHQSKYLNHIDKSRKNIIYFGMLRPEKGLEEVLELAGLIRDKQLPLTITIIGRIIPQHKDYYFTLRASNIDLESIVTWEVDVSESVVSEILGSCLFAYLPFPDGVSERRGSLFAALAHQMLVITRRGDFTPPNFEDCMFFVNSPEEALNRIMLLLDINMAEYGNVVNGIKSFMHDYSWESIIPQYCELFKVIKNRSDKI